MCTSPNYMMFRGTHINEDMDVVPTYEFCGHHQYEKLMTSGVPFIQVPCGKCLECRIQQVRTWSDRCVLEAKNSPYNYFVTLTYDDDHLPYKKSLNPDHLTQFINLLRKHFKRKLKFEGKIRFFASGEYGTGGDRIMNPHYHLILFNCPIPDLSDEFWLEQDGLLTKHLRPQCKCDGVKHSMLIYDLWQRRGMISVEPFDYDAASYVTQYVTKKIHQDYSKQFEELHIVPEFLRMSNGIGRNAFDDNNFIHDNGKMVIAKSGLAHKSSVPRYFDKLFIKKYGRGIFEGTIGSRRFVKRIQNVGTNLNKGVKYDRQCEIRAHNIEAQHRFKKGL